MSAAGPASLALALLLLASAAPARADTTTREREVAQLAARSLPSEVRTTDWSLRIVPWRYLRMNGLPILAARTRAPADADGVPLQRWRDGRLVYNPTVLAEHGMRRLDSWLRTGRKVHLDRALAIADRLDHQAIIRGDLRWQPHRYDHDSQELDGPWVNSNSHGLALSFYSRFYQLTDRPRFRRTADALFRAYQRLETATTPRWFATVYPDGHLWYEHYPEGRQLGVLNAHLNAAFGLYDYWRITGSGEAADAFRAALTTANEEFSEFRRPRRLSAYSLVHPHFSLGYHRTHRQQYRLAARMTGDGIFARKARILWEDERAWLSR